MKIFHSAISVVILCTAAVFGLAPLQAMAESAETQCPQQQGSCSLHIIEPQGPTKPEPSVASVSTGSVTLEWDPVPGAQRYAVATRLRGGGYVTHTYDCTEGGYTVRGLEDGVEYSFLVQAMIDGSWTRFDETDLVAATPWDPNAPAVTASASGSGCISLAWPPIPGARCYAVAELTPAGYQPLDNNVFNTSYEVTGLSNGREHRFLVQAMVNGSWSSNSRAYVASATPQGPTKPEAVAAPGERNVTLTWDHIPGATKYAIAIYRGDGRYENVTTNFTGNKYTVDRLNGKTNYCFIVQAYIDKKWSSFTADDYVHATPYDHTAPEAWIAEIGNGTATLEWNPIPNAVAYSVSEYINGRYFSFTTECKSTRYTVSDLGNGYPHQLLVQAKVDNSWSSYGSSYLITATPQGIMKPTASARAGIEKVELSWNKVPGATRYAVARVVDGKFINITTNCTSESYTINNLSENTEYTFLVQAFVCGHWSSFNSNDYVHATPKPSPMPYDKKQMLKKANYSASKTGYLILVNCTTNKVGIFRGRQGEWIYDKYWDCTSGAPSTPSVKGDFTVQNKGLSFGRGYTCWYWTQWYGDYLFHSVLYYPGSKTHVQDGRLGINASHGCIRLELQNAKWIYDVIPRGTKVVVY